MRRVAGAVIKDGARRGMYTASPPWWVKLGVLLMFYQQHAREEGQPI